MPISSQVPIIGYVANGVTKSFAFPFAILSADDLKVKVGADVVTTGFSIAGVGDRDGGSVTFTDAPASLTPIILYREVTLDRTTDYQENGDLLAIVLDDDLDRIWMALQDQLLLSDRALRAPLGETLQELPPASKRALMALAFDKDGQPIVVRDTTDGGAALSLDLLDTAPGKGAELVGSNDGASGSLWTTVAGFIQRILSSAGSSVMGFIQSGAGAVQRTVQDELRDHVSVKQFATPNDALTRKTSNTNFALVPIGTYTLTSGVNYSAYSYFAGFGDESRLMVPAGATGLAYTSQSGVYDDHPHNFIKDLRVSGDGVFQAFPASQNGTSKGIAFATVDQIGSFGSVSGASIELHDIGRHIKKSYSHNGEYNYYRANKVGLKLEETTSYTETNSYFRYNSTAAVQIIGSQNITIRGGAIEGNPGIGLQYIAGASTWGQLNLHDVYFESNGNQTTGIWSIDVPYGSPLMVNVTGGSMWLNVSNGVTSGPYRLGDNVTFDGTTMNGCFYCKYARVRNIRGGPSWNTMGSEPLDRLFGLSEPTVMLEYSPVVQEYDFSAALGGTVFCTQVQGRGSVKTPGSTNQASYVYPYGFTASSGAVGSANAALNYGEGDFFKVQFAASVGNFSSNYATLDYFGGTTKPYRISCLMFRPESDCEIGIVQSVGGQSVAAFYSLKANKFYRMVIQAMRPMTAGSYLRVFPINAAGPAINFLPIWSSQHATHAEQLRIVKMLVDGAL